MLNTKLETSTCTNVHSNGSGATATEFCVEWFNHSTSSPVFIDWVQPFFFFSAIIFLMTFTLVLNFFKKKDI